MNDNIISLSEFANRPYVFRNREHAGEILGDMIREAVGENAILLAIPAGGVPVAMAVSEVTKIAFDIAAVSKITLPWNSEAGYGAVAFDGTIRMNEALLKRLELTDHDVREGIEKTTAKVKQRNRSLRGGRPFPALAGKTAVLVDDGLASGFTMFCAIDAVKNAKANEIVVAVPTAHSQSATAVAEKADRLFCPNIRGGARFAVAEAYENWSDISEQELLRMLDLA